MYILTQSCIVISTHPYYSLSLARSLPSSSYPLIVKITTDTGKVVWEGSQKALFRKNGHTAKPEITRAARAFAK